MAFQQVSRRRFCLSTAAAALTSSTLLAQSAQQNAAARPTPQAAMQQLLEGNRHFVAGSLTHPGRSPNDFRQLAKTQQPIAAILGCADSRVPPEILFDQPIGGIFVVRIASNYVSGAGSAVKGSLEYAVIELNVPLIVVLGHSGCGAVKAAMHHILDHDALPGALNDLVNNIKPAVLASAGSTGDPLQAAIEANITRSVRRLETLAPTLAPRVHGHTLNIVGMSYDLSDGRVHVLAT